MSDLNLLQWGALIVAAMIVWSLLAVICLMVFHGASRLREEARSAGGVKRGNLPRSWRVSHSVSESSDDPSPSESAASR